MQLVKKKKKGGKKKAPQNLNFHTQFVFPQRAFSLQRAEICQICGEKVFLQRQTCLGCWCLFLCLLMRSARSRGAADLGCGPRTRGAFKQTWWNILGASSRSASVRGAL